MARQVRMERAGAWYHVTSRGIDRRDIFKDDRDRKHWLGLLAEAREMFKLVVHSYVLIPNHFHLMLETREANLSRAMHWFNTSYTVWFNRRHRRVGPLYQGRYKAIVVDPEEWGQELSRYIHLNSVRIKALGLDKQARKADRLGLRGKPDAELVRKRIAHLRDYRWSSYRAYIGLEKEPEWLETRVVLGMGGRGSQREQRRSYRGYVEEAGREGLEESPWENLTSQLILGGKEFVDEVRGAVRGRRRECPQVQGLVERPDFSRVMSVVEEVKGESWEEFVNQHGDWGRDLALYLGRKECGLSLRDLGKEVGGADYAAVSVAVKRFEKRVKQERKLTKVVKKALQLLNVET
jgi:putative transposase